MVWNQCLFQFEGDHEEISCWAHVEFAVKSWSHVSKRTQLLRRLKKENEELNSKVITKKEENLENEVEKVLAAIDEKPRVQQVNRVGSSGADPCSTLEGIFVEYRYEQMKKGRNGRFLRTKFRLTACWTKW